MECSLPTCPGLIPFRLPYYAALHATGFFAMMCSRRRKCLYAARSSTTMIH
ncbi:hypothetical protein K440DRAFT_164098 [Wilcoxina mikolae CBS 423.85]|nr:hypothetical protein K440DRAFT_164098 [Wilcoxina mikolae CBS 423.85]